ncbi:MAG: choice-of-anchor V domain-containing protein [Ignavibacteriaceae bacterium]
MKKILFLSLLLAVAGYSYQSYTGYSGAPGSKGTCASSCHGSGTGTITVSGFPSVYTPGKSYTVSVQYTSGSKISNFNASTRLGTTTTGAGTFASGLNSAVYTSSGYEAGVRGSANNISSATFSWTAPAAGSGNVTLYLAGLQGSKSGTNTKLVLTSTEEIVSSVSENKDNPESFQLAQNYPNPFNPATTISFRLAEAGKVTLKIYNLLGNEEAVLFNGSLNAGVHSLPFDAAGLPGGIYFYTLQSGSYSATKKMVLLK